MTRLTIRSPAIRRLTIRRLVACASSVIIAASLTLACDDSGPSETVDTLAMDLGPADLADAPDTAQTSPYEFALPGRFPAPDLPEEAAPMTDELVELGRHLFYDRRLSFNETQSCGDCHEQALGFTDGLTVSIGSTGEMTPRNSPTLTNVAYNATLTWANPILTALEVQLQGPVLGEQPIELGVSGHEAEVFGRFAADPLYQELFGAAFPAVEDPYDLLHILQAISAFCRTMISGNSSYDRWAAGDPSALSDSALAGLNLFFSERLECHHCHGGFNFSQSTRFDNTVFEEQPFHNTGLYNTDGMGGYPLNNTGLYEFTGEPADMGKFRAPTLRNIAVTGPYMHDGSVDTLDEVIRIYERGGRLVESGPYAGDGAESPIKDPFMVGFTLSDFERQALLDFLESLTDDEFLTDPRFANPFE